MRHVAIAVAIGVAWMCSTPVGAAAGPSAPVSPARATPAPGTPTVTVRGLCSGPLATVLVATPTAVALRAGDRLAIADATAVQGSVLVADPGFGKPVAVPVGGTVVVTYPSPAVTTTYPLTLSCGAIGVQTPVAVAVGAIGRPVPPMPLPLPAPVPVSGGAGSPPVVGRPAVPPRRVATPGTPAQAFRPVHLPPGFGQVPAADSGSTVARSPGAN